MHRIRSAVGGLLALVGAGWTVVAPAQVYRVDWPAALAAAESQPQRFAVAVPAQIDALSQGLWQAEGPDRLMWRHRIEVPGALSLSFRASRLRLPEGARLRMAGIATPVAPDAEGHWWSPAAPGAVLDLELSLPRGAWPALQFQIDELQAGFRDPLAPAPAAKAASGCTVNFACSARNDALTWGQSVVAITVHNAVGCTATLVNNSGQDGRPYLLSARHCRLQDGVVDDPVRAAASLRVQWNAVSPCGETLASASSVAAQSSSGARHRADAGDVWLLELDAPPPASAQAWYAGLDASEQPPSGELTGIHHAGRMARQMVWSAGGLQSQLLDVVLGLLPVWRMYSELGAGTAGASGSALFSQAGQVVGVLSLASGCETEPLPSLYYSRLGAAWTGDGSREGSLQAWLDPAGGGRRIPGKAAAGAAPVSSGGGSSVEHQPSAVELGGGGSLDPGLLAVLLLLVPWRRNRHKC